jgi:hypothetical protein
MNIKITIGDVDPHVLILVQHPPMHAPRWLLIMPDNSLKPFITDPGDWQLEQSRGFGEESGALLETAKALLAGEISQIEAAKRFEAALTAWSNRIWPACPSSCREDSLSRGLTP